MLHWNNRFALVLVVAAAVVASVCGFAGVAPAGHGFYW